jgi:hypothetical protein
VRRLIDAIVIMLNWRWTPLVLMPINNKVMAVDDASAPHAGAAADPGGREDG